MESCEEMIQHLHQFLKLIQITHLHSYLARPPRSNPSQHYFLPKKQLTNLLLRSKTMHLGYWLQLYSKTPTITPDLWFYYKICTLIQIKFLIQRRLMEFKTIEEKLNRLCSQHDEYISLLDIADYLANLKGLGQNNRNAYNKICVLEQSIQEIQDAQSQQRAQQQDLGVAKLEKFKKNIIQIQQKLQQYSTLLLQFEGSVKQIEIASTHFAHHKEINQVNTQLEAIIDNDTKANLTSIALYKNDLECKLLDAKETVKRICNGNSSENGDETSQKAQTCTQATIDKVLKNELQDYDKLYHQILLYRFQFPIPPLLPFVQFNYERIKEQISSLFSIININEELLDQSEFSILQQEYYTLFYQTKAIKNFVLCQLLQLYDQSSKVETNKLEKQIGLMLKELQNRLELLKEFIRKAQRQRRNSGGTTLQERTNDLCIHSIPL